MRQAFRNGAKQSDVARTLRRGLSSIEQKLKEVAGGKSPEAIAAWAAQMPAEEAELLNETVVEPLPKLRPREIVLYDGRVLRSKQWEAPVLYDGSPRVVVSLSAL